MFKGSVYVLAGTVIFFVAEAFAQLQWANVSPTPSPCPRRQHALAYDFARGQTVLFGGWSFLPYCMDQQTWEWDGTRWTNVTPVPPAQNPAARGGHALAYDAARARTVLFGSDILAPGFPFEFVSDTWEWNGSFWTERCGPSGGQCGPVGRMGHGMAYDAARRVTILFGGRRYGGSALADTWAWDGTVWRNVSPSGGPSPRHEHAMTYDAARQQVVLYGGQDEAGGTLSDTWAWDGSTWILRSPCASPGPRQGHAMAYDSTFNRIVLFGGWRCTPPNPVPTCGTANDTWLWNGTDWGQALPASAPPPAREQHAVAYDSVRSRLVLFGGYPGTGTSSLADTWELSEGSAPITVRGRVVLRTSSYAPPVMIPGASVKVSQNSIPGWIAQGLSDTTGWYTIVLPQSARPGSYTIRASLVFDPLEHPPVVNYRYCNPAQNPELNPDRDSIQLSSGMNDNLDIYVPQPVILVHGAFANAETWLEGEALLRLDPRQKSRVPQGQQPPGWDPGWTWPGPIAHRGYIAWSVTYGPLQTQRTLLENATRLEAQVAAKRTFLSRFQLAGVPIDIVAHSMGGLVTREYLNLSTTPGNSVDRVLMFGTPNAGIGFLLGLYPYLIGAWPAVAQTDPLYLLTLFESRVTRTGGARFILVGCDRSYSAEPEFLGLGLPTEDDGLVSTFSAHYLPGFYPVLWRFPTGDPHNELHTNIRATLNTVLLSSLESRRQ